MSEKSPSSIPPSEGGEDERLRKRLMQRVAVAAVVVAGLLTALIAFEASMRPEPPAAPAKVAAEPPPTPIEPPSDEKVATAGEAPAEANAESEKTAATEPSAEATAMPDKTAAADNEPAAEPEVSEAPQLAPRRDRPLTVPAQTQKATLRTAEGTVQKDKAGTEKAAAAPAPAREVSRLASRSVSGLLDGAHRFLVQVGVFSNPTNAEELRAKIESAGMPVHIETRVQVGPFATRQEAERASENLRWLGLDPGMVVTARK